MSLIEPVFETVWKRIETKIYLAIAIIFPLVFLASTFLPKGSNFMVPTPATGEFFSYLDLLTGILGAASSLTLPTLALFLLTFSVFRSEADTHLMFLYKDLPRKDIFRAKMISLILIVLIFLTIFGVIMGVIFYGRVAYMPYAKPQFVPTNMEIFVSDLSIIWSFFLENCIGLFLATFLSLRIGKAVTLATAFAYSIGGMILVNIGDPIAKLFPSGYLNWETFDSSLWIDFGKAGLLSLFYCAILSYLTYKHFKTMEY